ncbi:MAG TPA: SCO family protein [Polyangiaceae bacterium]|nr:SCO family protein [Polyangiaceae bacterium]
MTTPGPTPDAREERQAQRGYWAKRLGLRILVMCFGLGLVTAFGYYTREHGPAPALKVYGHVPTFQLQDQKGAPFNDGALTGHVSVVDFIFTRCASSCPELTAQMAQLQGRLASAGSNAKLVSFSVDPENDTPPVLAEYASHAGADPARWSFVTGPVDSMKAAVVTGFKMAMEKLPKGTNDYDVTHGDWFVLIDPRGDIRGYYTVDEPKDLDRLMHDVQRLEPSRN